MSGVVFLKYIFGDVIPTSIPISVIKDRTLDADLNPTKSCSDYDSVKYGRRESRKWLSKHVPSIASRISSEIGLLLSTSETISLLELCVALIGLYNANLRVGICQLFNKSDLEIYDILSDVIHYQSEGYAYPCNSGIACSLLSGIVKEMKASIRNETRSHVRFTHAETVIPLISALGLFKDNFIVDSGTSLEVLRKRKFRTSVFSPFMGNLIFELQDCRGKYVVRIRINEVLHEIPSCGDCTLENFIKSYRHLIGCNYDKLCGNTRPTQGGWRY